MAYATVEDYLLVYDSDAETSRLQAFLDKASRKIDAALASRGAEVPEDMSDELEDALRDVACDMAHRVLGDGSGEGMPGGITSYSQSQGGFSESFSWPAPYTDLVVRADELRWLLSLIGRQSPAAGVYRMWGGEVT